MQRALRLRETSDIEDFVAEAVAPAIQTPTVHRRLQTSRDQVAARFFKHGSESCGRVLSWLAICSPMMRYHFRLFRDVTWHSHRRQQDAFRDVSPYNYMGSMDVNPAGKVYDELSQMFLDAEGTGAKHLLILTGIFEKASSWPRKYLGLIRQGLVPALTAFSTLVMDELKQHPYLAAEIFHSDHTEEARLHFTRKLFAAPDCCLDPLTKKMKDRFKRAEELLTPPVQAFSMTFLEGCCHVNLLRKTFLPAHELGKQKPQGLPLLAAEHVNLQFQLGVQRARSSADLGASASNRSRPAWAQKGCTRSGRGRASTCSAESRMGRFGPNAWAASWRSLSSEGRRD